MVSALLCAVVLGAWMSTAAPCDYSNYPPNGLILVADGNCATSGKPVCVVYNNCTRPNVAIDINNPVYTNCIGVGDMNNYPPTASSLYLVYDLSTSHNLFWIEPLRQSRPLR